MMKELKRQKLGHDIAALPDHIVGRAEYLKDYFDRNVYEVLLEVIHPLIDSLTAESGADEIGAKEFSAIPAGTVQSQLIALKEMMDRMQWGIPDSLETEVIKDGAVTEEKLSDAVQQRLEQADYVAECETADGVVVLEAELPDDTCTVRFTADAAYVKGNTLTLNGESYTLMLPNGKALPDNAWISGAVVCLQINPETKTAFFNGGGADLSFVTAGAEQILSGFMGANAEGEPVEGIAEGWITETVTGTKSVSVAASTTTTSSIAYPEQGKPKAIAMVIGSHDSTAAAAKTSLRNGGSNIYKRCFWIDGFLDTEYTTYWSNNYARFDVTDTQINITYYWSGYSACTSYIYYEFYY